MVPKVMTQCLCFKKLCEIKIISPQTSPLSSLSPPVPASSSGPEPHTTSPRLPSSLLSHSRTGSSSRLLLYPGPGSPHLQPWNHQDHLSSPNLKRSNPIQVYYNHLPFNPEPPKILQRTRQTLSNNRKPSHDTPPEGKIISRSDHRSLRSAKVQKPLLSPPLQDLLTVPVIIRP